MGDIELSLRSSIQCPLYSFIHSSIHTPTQTFIYTPTHPCIYPSIHQYIHLPTHSFTQKETKGTFTLISAKRQRNTLDWLLWVQKRKKFQQKVNTHKHFPKTKIWNNIIFSNTDKKFIMCHTCVRISIKFWQMFSTKCENKMPC